MADKRVLVVAVCLFIGRSSLAFYANTKVPLDISYILNDLDGVQDGLVDLNGGLPDLALGGPGDGPQPPVDNAYPQGYPPQDDAYTGPGAPDPYRPSGQAGGDNSGYPYGVLPPVDVNSGVPGQTSVYANGAGDAVYSVKRNQGSASDHALPEQRPAAAPGHAVPIEYIYPLYPDGGNSAPQDADLSGFGQNYASNNNNNNHHHYPIEIPPSRSPGQPLSNGYLPSDNQHNVPAAYPDPNAPYPLVPEGDGLGPKVLIDYGGLDGSQSPAGSLPQPHVSLGTSRDGHSSLSHPLPADDSHPASFSANDNYAGPQDGSYLPLPAAPGDVNLGHVLGVPAVVPAAGSGGAAGGGGYGVEPQHTYPVDVYDYRHDLQCWPQFFLEYEHDFSGAVWQDVKGQVHVDQGRAVFQGQGFLAIPFFACNDFHRRYSMIFVISPSYSGSGPQAVIGNSIFSDKATLLVSLTGNTLSLVIRERAPGLTPQQLLNHCYSRKRRSVGHPGQLDPHHGATGQDSQGAAYGDVVVLQLTIPSGEVMVTIAQEKNWVFLSAGDDHVTKPGRLPALTNEALYVGAGADPRGGGELHHYTGTFDSFLFETCP